MKNRVLFFCFLWNELQGFLAEDGIGATRVPTGNLYSAEISTFINLEAAKDLARFQNFTNTSKFWLREKVFFKEDLFLSWCRLTHITHMVLDWSVNNVKEGRNLFSYSLSRRTEMSHMICESLVNPKKSSRWKRCPNFDWKNYVSDENFQFSGALFAIPIPAKSNLKFDHAIRYMSW